MQNDLITRLKGRAAKLGFCSARITEASLPDKAGENLRQAVAEGHHGSMDWMKSTLERRVQPTAMWAEARSAIMLAMNYGPQLDPMARLSEKSSGIISVYALNRDYHAVIKGKLKELAQWLASQTGADVKVFVDTAPIMEKPLAERAGIGWQGKHTNIVSTEYGSWLFLGCILTTADLDKDDAETDHCGSCRACLDVCPTDAFPAPYRLDARRCISYLTIEHKGHIDRHLRPLMGNRIFGCDDCLAVCPWNKFAEAGREARLAARDELVDPPLAELSQLDDAKFRKLFVGSPVRRIGRDRFVRNVMIAMGNSHDRTLAPVVAERLRDDAAEVRAAAVWALSRLLGRRDFTAMKSMHLGSERDDAVRAEWST